MLGAKDTKNASGSRLAVNTFSNFLGQAMVMLLTFFSTPYITRKMGSVQYGALSLLMVYLFSFSIVNLGINTSLVKYLAELLPRMEYGEIQQYVSTALTTLLTAGIVAGIAVFLAATPLVHYLFKDTAELTGKAVLALRIASIAFILQFVIQVVSSVCIAAQKFEIVNSVRVASEVLRIGGTIAILAGGGGLPALLAWVMFTSLFLCVAYAVASKRIVPSLDFRPRFSRRHLHSLLHHSKYVVITNVSNQVAGSADNVILGAFLPVANQAYYGIAYTLAQRFWVLVANISSVVFPAASAFSANARPDQVRELYLRGSKIAAAAACFPAFALCLFSRPFLLYWLGPEYADHGALVLSLLILGFMVNAFSLVAYQVLQSTHYVSTAARASVVYVIVNVAMFVACIPKFGLAGASAGFLAAQLLFVPWFVMKANRLLEVKWRELIFAAYLRVFLISVGACGISWLLHPWVRSLFTLGVAVAVGLCSYALLSYVFVLDEEEKAACRLLVHRLASVLDIRKAAISKAAAINS
jgi:O-antigen/teichoic acid export membrane protein